MHLLSRLFPYGYGKDILRARYKLYLADAAIAPAILLKGKTILEDTASLGHAAETAVFNHLLAHSSTTHARYSYWLSPKNKELDLIVEVGTRLLPFEVKYQSQKTVLHDIQGLTEFCRQKSGPERSIEHAYVLTKEAQDIGILEHSGTKIMRCPASLFCYFLGRSELVQQP
jgi:predicted AAA+ superfamily ATPase